MPKELLKMYEKLSEIKKQEVYDFVAYLTLRQDKQSKDEVEAILDEANEYAKKVGTNDITLDEINDEITLCRYGK